MKYTTEDFKRLVLCNNRGDGKDFKVISEYTGTGKKIKMVYLPLNREFLITPNHFLSGRRPPFYPNKRGWQNKKGFHDTTWFKEQVKRLVGNEYTVLEEYVNYDTPILIRHNCDLCNNAIFRMSPKMFIDRGHRCHICNWGTVQTEECEKNKWNKYFRNSGFKVESIDKKNNLILFKHSACGRTFYRKRKYVQSYITKNSIICPFCKVKSKGNAIVENFLSSHNIPFIPEYNPADLYRLRFDFWINDSIMLEVDGIQHRKQIEYFDAKDDFERRKKRDEMKDKYCRDKNIPLERICLPGCIRKKDEITIIKQLTEILDRYKLL